MEGLCHCHVGWEGPGCREEACDPRCALHGTCTSGVCECSQGWGGHHCTLDFCPSACSGHGSCVRGGEGWRCACQEGWRSPTSPRPQDCSLPQEIACADGLDNDQGKHSLAESSHPSYLLQMA